MDLIAWYVTAMNKSMQQIMDETMCRPGYRWNETLKRCLAAGGGGAIDAPELPAPPNVEPPPSNGELPPAPAPPVGTGRGDVRVNANGVMQKGTNMGGRSASVK